MTLEEYIASEAARGVPAEIAKSRWNSVRAWGSAPEDPVFWSPPEQDNLEAAATSIAIDPAAKRREEIARRSAAYLRDQERRTSQLDATLAEMYGHGPSGRIEPASTVSVDGVTVPSVMGADGQPLGDGQYYRLGDVKRAQEQAASDALDRTWRQSIEEDKAKYGDPMLPDESDSLTPEQYAARIARKRAEVAEQMTPRAKELRRGRLHARAGVLEEATDDMSEEQTLRMMARNQDQLRSAAARDMITRRAQAQQNPLEYLGNPGTNDWQRMVAAQSVLRGRMPQRTPIDVDIALAANSGKAAEVGVMNREVDARLEALRNQMEQTRADRETQNNQFLLKLEEMRQDRQRQASADAERFDIARAEAANRQQATLAELQLGRERNETEQEKYRSVLESQQAERSLERERAEQLREIEFQRQAPGLYDIMTGRANTESAIEALKNIAAKSDNFQWLPGGGFGIREATAMNDELLTLARQAEMLGIDSRLSDPAYRRELIERWGYASGWSGGRGGWVGDLWQPMPEDLQ